MMAGKLNKQRKEQIHDPNIVYTELSPRTQGDHIAAQNAGMYSYVDLWDGDVGGQIHREHTLEHGAQRYACTDIFFM